MTKQPAVRWLSMLTLIAIVLATVVLFSQHSRDGVLYRAISKIVFPVSKQLTTTSEQVTEPGFAAKLDRSPKDWTWIRREQTNSSFGPTGLTITPKIETVWWKNERGPLFHTQVAGDFDAVVTVDTRKTSEPNSYPDKAYQFGGLMVRDPRGAAWFSQESYVFVAVGHRGKGLQIESKSTNNGYSTVNGIDWPSGKAQLRIKRTGRSFELYARAAETGAKWQRVDVFDRDLPETLQLGLFAYAYSGGKGIVDITARFSNLGIENAKP